MLVTEYERIHSDLWELFILEGFLKEASFFSKFS